MISYKFIASVHFLAILPEEGLLAETFSYKEYCDKKVGSSIRCQLHYIIMHDMQA